MYRSCHYSSASGMLDVMNLFRPNVAIDVFPLDPQGRAKSIGWQLSARYQPPHLFLTEAQVPGGLLDGVEGGTRGLFTAK